MISQQSFQQLALSFPNTEQIPHFERIGFKVIGKRMFCSYYDKDNTANVFLTPAEQKLFCKTDKKNIYPVPNKWGEKGATTFRLDSVDEEVLKEAMKSAYDEVFRKVK